MLLRGFWSFYVVVNEWKFLCFLSIIPYITPTSKLEPVPENSTDQQWKWFKNFLGALDGTHIKCLVPIEDKPRYRTRKNNIATNVLGVCSQDMQFIYVLPGWEGSAVDSRVLRDALLRPHGLKVPRPGYYLVDAGYTNGEGFLAPYRGQRYHLNDWRDGHQPTTPKEVFNMRHSSARNVIERCFGILKARWGILKDNSYYPVELKNRIIMACCLLHNFIRQEMLVDPFENSELDEGTGDVGGENDDNVTSVGISDEWTAFRNNLAQTMFDSWIIAEKGRNYRNWTPSEDAKLVDALVNMVVYDMVNGTNTSGFGYDSDRHCVYAEAAVWESYIEVHKDAGTSTSSNHPESSYALRNRHRKKASMVAIEISKMGSMTVVDKFKASRKIMRDPQAVATFWNYEGEDREMFVWLMLQE
ncbi:hypothetical protein L1887_25498 [Cichorium endivia]|nr:hypothetical protein L1887_25498 [Cichorium endivia]